MKLEYKIYKYNELTKRLDNAERWLDSPDVSVDEAKEWEPEIQKIILELNALYSDLKKNGIKVEAGKLIAR